MIVTIIIILALVLSFINTFSPSLSTLKEGVSLPTEKESTTPYTPQTYTPQASTPETSTPETPTPETQTLEVTTRIISGPEQGEIIDETNQITFEFDLKVRDESQRTRFETKMLDFDTDWKSTSSNKRTITLPPGPKEYTFLVREKEKAETTSPAQRTFSLNISPYFDKVEISSVQTQTPSKITLNTHLARGEEISITGWQVKGKSGGFTIPYGVEKYSPYYNPVPTKSIFVKRSDKIYLSSASNPLGKDRNFRPNKCLGYLTNYWDFAIPLSINCPRPQRGEISHLDPSCQGFILDMEKCEAPDYSKSIKISSDPECVSYLNENFSYANCFRNYSEDQDFIMQNWHIYMDRSSVVGSGCETLYLRDQDNLFIDKYFYGESRCSW